MNSRRTIPRVKNQDLWLRDDQGPTLINDEGEKSYGRSLNNVLYGKGMLIDLNEWACGHVGFETCAEWTYSCYGFHSKGDVS